MLGGAVCAFIAAWFSFEQNGVWAMRFGIAALILYVAAIVARRSNK